MNREGRGRYATRKSNGVADIAALATFLPLAAPTAAQTAAATKALIRALANSADVVPAQRATINVLADTIRFLLQR